MYKSVETLLVDIPTIRPHKLSVATMQTQTLVLVKITATDGTVGWGEATTIGGLSYGEESPESVKAKDIAEAKKMIELKRHNTFKLKIGARPLQEDVDHVIAIKKALGPEVSIRVDINRAWTELECIRGIQQLQDGGIDLIEQPCAIQNTDALARLTQRFEVAIMADEALTGPDSAFRIAQKHGADVFAVKVEQSGGLIEACDVAKIACLAGIDLYGGTMLEGPVGTIASAHAFSTFENLAFGTELFGPLLLTQEILTTPLQYENFELVVPNAPGLGIEVDENKIEQLRR